MDPPSSLLLPASTMNNESVLDTEEEDEDEDDPVDDEVDPPLLPTSCPNNERYC
jgi:hypothetical protein